jgi:hypothetical protein
MTLAQLKPDGQTLIICVLGIWYQPSAEDRPPPDEANVVAEALDDCADVFPAASNAETL